MKLLRLTARGETMLQNLFPLAEQFNRAGTRNISSADLETFKRVMDQMVYNVQHLDEE